MPDTKVRISQAIYEQLRQLAEKSGKSMRELAEEAIRAYLLGSTGVEGKEIKGVTAKIIPLQYPAKCKRCGRQLNPGELAYWVKITFNDNSTRSFIYCLDCYYQTSALKEHYIKKRQLEKIIRELKKEADTLADRIIQLRAEADIYEAIRDIQQIARELYTMLDYILDKEKKDAVKEIIRRVERIEQRLQEISDSVEAINIEATRKIRKVQSNARKSRYY